MFAGRHGDGGALAQQAAARLAGGTRPRRRAEAEGRAEGWWSRRKLRTTTRRRRRAARASGPSQALSLPAAGGWMGLLQAVAAAAKVAAAAAAAAVSAASTSHLSPSVPVWDEGLLRCPQSLSLLPLPHSSVPPGRPLTSGEGLPQNAPGLLAVGGRRRMRSSLPATAHYLPAPPFCLRGGGGALGIRCGVSSPRPVRFGP